MRLHENLIIPWLIPARPDWIAYAMRLAILACVVWLGVLLWRQIREIAYRRHCRRRIGL
jgi:hypothetical protein